MAKWTRKETVEVLKPIWKECRMQSSKYQKDEDKGEGVL